MESEQELKYFVRIANNDLDGKNAIINSLTKIKGIGFTLANAVCNISGINKRKKTGYLTDQEAKKIEEIINDPLKHDIPAWLFNRRKDPEDNKDNHLIMSNLDFAKDNDIKLMRKIKSYKGVRHSSGLPVRGQRTRSNFRKNKGNVLGVKRKAAAKGGKT